jgi:hypothetical protein
MKTQQFRYPCERSLWSSSETGKGILIRLPRSLLCRNHPFLYSLLFRNQFVPYSTTKYIYVLGKNGFEANAQLVVRIWTGLAKIKHIYQIQLEQN